MSAPGSRAIVSRQDIEQAQAVLDAWSTDWHGVENIPTKERAYLRGLITQALADAHAQGYDEGVQRGRRLVGARLHEVLEEEGL